MNNEICPKCHTSAEEVLTTGFAGCEKCYEMPSVKTAIEKMYGGKHHKN